MHKIAVIGNPVNHSLSPVVFDMFAKQCGIQLTYERILANDDSHFEQVVHEFFQQGGLALNITSPFKRAAYNVAKMHTSRATFCQASNFLYHDAGGVVAATTDGPGLIQDLQTNKQINLANKQILILGSGFVLDSILLDLIVANPLSIDVLARNRERLSDLQSKFAVGTILSGNLTKYDIILNTVPNIENNELLTQINKQIFPGTICYDMTYSAGLNSVFLQNCRQASPTALLYTGIGMLVEQAKIAFEQLFACRVDTTHALQELEKE